MALFPRSDHVPVASTSRQTLGRVGGACMIELLRSHSAIPLPPTPLIGREDELAVALSLLRDSGVRLVTLLGPGGVGKTRLALELARFLDDDFAAGVALVRMESITDAGLIPTAIDSACGSSVMGARPSRSAAPPVTHRHGRLLVLDNFEHLLPAASAVAELLAADANVKILVTSREPLHLQAEHRVVVPPLALSLERALPETSHAADPALAESPAVTLFVERAQAVRRDFFLSDANAATVAAICARLDGLPLAIELAAARVTHLSPAAILERIDRRRSARLSLLTGGPRDVPARLRTMRDAIAWSHDLLSDQERLLFRRLAVLSPGFDAAAAIAVGARDEWETIDRLRALLEKSLLCAAYSPAGEPRFRMLETIRAFAWEQLVASGEEEAVQRLHDHWQLTHGEHCAAGSLPADTAHRPGPSDQEDASPAVVPAASATAAEPARPCLTPREWEVLRLLTQGLCDKEIAAILRISPQTATKHVGNLLPKLGTHSRTAAATFAVRRGYV